MQFRKKAPFAASVVICAFMLALQWSSVGCSPNEKAAEAVSLNDWILKKAIPLDSVTAESGLEDILPLKKYLDGVKIVALGEATHGTREFFQFKHRMLEFLVKEMGFTVFAIEASLPACTKINDYVLYGKGDRDEALAGQGFWTWDTVEVAEMIEWMRRYNETVSEDSKVKFYGFDLQVLEAAEEYLVGFFKKVDPDFSESLQKILSPLGIKSQKYFNISKAPAEEKKEIRRNLLSLIGRLSFQEGAYSRSSSKEALRYAVQMARIIYQFYDVNADVVFTDMESRWKASAMRDMYMAENITHILDLEGPETKIVLWAHNSHISRSGWRKEHRPTGNHLKDQFGDAYYSMGFFFNRGGFRAWNMDRSNPDRKGVIGFEVGAAPEEYAEAAFYKAEIGDFILDLRTVPETGDAAVWVNAVHPTRHIGSGFTEENPEYFVSEVNLAASFDAVVFIEKTTTAVPNKKKKPE